VDESVDGVPQSKAAKGAVNGRQVSLINTTDTHARATPSLHRLEEFKTLLILEASKWVRLFSPARGLKADGSVRISGVQSIALALNEVDVLRDECSLCRDARFEASELFLKRVQSRDDISEHFEMFFGRQNGAILRGTQKKLISESPSTAALYPQD
jgi:hypothetical protein